MTSPMADVVQPTFTWRETLSRYYRVFQTKRSIHNTLLQLRKNKLSPCAPTFTRSYRCQPGYHHRFFLPNNSTPKANLPVYLDFHAGGFVVGDAEFDDEFCRHLADTFQMLVISIEYPLAPLSVYPKPIEAAAVSIEAILQDTHLPIDQGKIALGGFSAGGQLIFGLAQLPAMQGRIGALVGFYPVLDFATEIEHKLTTRTGEAQKNPDPLTGIAELLNWAYIPGGRDLRDPLLSPFYADPQDLPQHVYLISAERDYLCHEAELFAEKLAGSGDHAPKEPIQAVERGWKQGGVRWEMAMGLGHAFTHDNMDGTRDVAAVTYCDGLHARIGRWLRDDVFQSQG